MEWRLSNEYIEYNYSLEAMKQRVQDIISREKEELIWFLEHLPVYTAGSSAQDSEFLGATTNCSTRSNNKDNNNNNNSKIIKEHESQHSCDYKGHNICNEGFSTANILNIQGAPKGPYAKTSNRSNNNSSGINNTTIKDRKAEEASIIPVIQVGRGGKYTYHGPGQRVVYLLLDLKKRKLCDLRKYIFLLEEVIIIALQKLIPDIKAQRKADYIGVWIVVNGQEKKIAAIGVRITKWITYHGVAININPNLSHYQAIIPCGIKNFEVTSLANIKENISMQEFDLYLRQAFIEILLKRKLGTTE